MTTLNATQRIRAAKKTSAANELPRFRYLDDAVRYVDSIAGDLDELEALIKTQRKMLASVMLKGKKAQAAVEFEITAPSGKGAPKSNLKFKIDPSLTKVEVPDIKKLKTQYNLLEDLYDKHRALEMAEAQVAAQFPKEGRGEAYDEFVKGTRQLKAKVAKMMSETFAFLNQVAAAHVPKEFTKYQRAVQLEIEKHVPFKRNDHYLYVSVDDDGNIVFTDYIMLIDAVNEAGEIAPHLYISVQWVVGGPVRVQVNHEFESPSRLQREGGEQVGTVAEAVRAISHLLELEDFATSLGTVPLSTMLKMEPGQIDLAQFEYGNFIDKVKVDEDKITFTLRPDAKEMYDQVSYQLFEELKTMVRNSRTARWRMDVSKKPKEISFVLKSAAQEGDVSIHDADWMRSKFHLNDSQLRKVVHLLNHGG